MQAVPTLHIQRGLLEEGRGPARFARYLASMTGGGEDLELPLTLMNPMAREHVAELLDGWILAGADDALERATTTFDSTDLLQALPQAREYLATLRTSLVLVDDVGGGWTDRAQTDLKHRYIWKGEPSRGWATALLWTSEPVDIHVIAPRVAASIARCAWRSVHAEAGSLRAFLAQEAFAARMAHVAPSPVQAAIRDKVRGHLDAPPEAAWIAVCYGDAHAHRLGFDPLGVPVIDTPRGFPGAAVALALEADGVL